MREIKFRAWHLSQERMFSAEQMSEDQLTLLTTGRFINVSGVSTKLSRIYEHDEMIPLQYTGLKDKNGKEIYEGDIMDYGLGRTFYISFVGGSFVATFNERVINTMIPFYNYSAIGNIYETPHLIKIKEKMD